MNTMGLQNRQNIPGRTGFSLVEIMMVVLLIGILAGVTAPPMFSYLQASRFQTSTDRMIADLQYARTVSISSGSILRFTATPDGYTLANPNTGNVLRSRVFDDEMELAQDSSTDFFPWGMADAAAFNLSSCGQTRQINVLPTGMVEVP